MYKESSNILARVYNTFLKEEVHPSSELKQACDYLKLPVKTPESVVKASIVLTLTASIVSLTLLLIYYFSNNLSIILTAALLSMPLLVNHFYSNYYKDKYYAERIKDLGFLPDFFSLLITNLKINPNLENALINVSGFNYGRSTFEVRKIVRDLESGKESDVKKRFIGLMKKFNNNSAESAANSLISALSIRSKTSRNQLLNNSLNYLLKGMIDETNKFSRKIYTPILLLFGFGTIIPLIIISVIPVIGLLKDSSFDINTVLLFFLASIFVTKLIINNLKSKSPSRFSQIVIDKEVKGVNIFLLLIIFIGLASPAIIYLFSNILPYYLNFLEGYQTLFLYISLSFVASLYFFSKSSNLIKEKNKAQRLEQDLIDSFYLLGSRINEGHSVESSLKYVSGIVSGEGKEFLKSAYHKISNLGLSVKTAFSSNHLLKNVYSERVKGLVELFVTSVQKHSLTASENIIEVCNYYKSIQAAEEEMMNSMSKNIDMIRLTTYFFSPVVCALIINIQRLINSVVSNSSFNFFQLSFSSLNVEFIQLIISSYVFFLTWIMSDLYSFLTSNSEKVASRYDKFKSLMFSCLAFTTTLIISRLLFFQL
ncbi:MAG: hypothetical protein JW791_03605 [Nanoarchaeota archaeon]|nr:hypothetical protein [Nanoarchaeota archaeon]